MNNRYTLAALTPLALLVLAGCEPTYTVTEVTADNETSAETSTQTAAHAARTAAPESDILAGFETGSTMSREDAEALLAGSAVQPGDEPDLQVGDPAPPLTVAGWLQGEPFTELADGSITVVEMWATWCIPCIRAIPHLNSLAAEYESHGVRVVGVNVLENSFGDSDKAADLTAFLEGKGARYPIAYEEDQTITNTWLFAAGRNSLPSTFIVDGDGRIAWIGNPGDPNGRSYVLAGKWRLQLSIDEALARIAAGDWNADDHRARTARSDLLARRLQRVADDLASGGDEQQGYDTIEALLATDLADEPILIDTLAWHIAEHPSVTDSRLDVAERLAATAIANSNNTYASAFDTLAKIRFKQGDTEQAIALERLAIDKAENAQVRGVFEDRLAEFQSAG